MKAQCLGLWLPVPKQIIPKRGNRHIRQDFSGMEWPWRIHWCPSPFLTPWSFTCIEPDHASFPALSTAGKQEWKEHHPSVLFISWICSNPAWADQRYLPACHYFTTFKNTLTDGFWCFDPQSIVIISLKRSQKELHVFLLRNKSSMLE